MNHNTHPLLSSLSIILIALLSLFSCTKTEEIEKLSPITTSANNTFGCLVDGKAWIPKTDGGLFNEKMTVRYENRGLSIQANLRINNETTWQLINVVVDFDDLGVYQIPPPPYPGEMFTNLKNKPMGRIECTSYTCTPEDTEIEILYISAAKRIIAGTFSYKNLTNECGDVVNITDGRFDVHY